MLVLGAGFGVNFAKGRFRRRFGVMFEGPLKNVCECVCVCAFVRACACSFYVFGVLF